MRGFSAIAAGGNSTRTPSRSSVATATPRSSVPRVVLEQNINGRPLHAVGHATVYGRDQVCVELIDTSAGVEVAILLREGLVDPVYWGSQPTLRLR